MELLKMLPARIRWPEIRMEGSSPKQASAIPRNRTAGLAPLKVAFAEMVTWVAESTLTTVAPAGIPFPVIVQPGVRRSVE